MSLWLSSYESLETNDTSQLVDKEGFVDWTGIGLAVLSVLLLSVKIVFGDVPTLYRFAHVVCGKNRYLLDYFYILVYRIMGRKEEESQVVHFGKYGYPLVLGKLGSTVQSVPYEMYGKTINDPNRWIEAKDSEDAKKWLKEQSSLAEKILKDSQAPFIPQGRSNDTRIALLDSFSKKVMQSSQYVEVDSVFQRGKHFFYFKSKKNSAGEAQSVQLFVTSNITIDAFDFQKGDKHGHLSKQDRMLLEAPKIDAVQTTLAGTWIDNDGEKMVYALCNDADGDWLTMKVRDVGSGVDQEDVLSMNCHRACTAVTWHNKRTGFFYSCFDGAGPDEEASNLVPAHVQHRVCFHRLGTPQEDDLVIYQEISEQSNNKDNKRVFFVPRMSHDGAYLLLDVLEEDFACIHYSEGPSSSEFHMDVSNRLFYIDVSRFNGRDLSSLGPVRRLIDGRGGNFCWDYVTNIGEDFWIRTNYCAEKFRVVRISIPGSDVLDRVLQGPDPEARMQFTLNASWHNSLEWIPETADGSYLESASIAAQTVLVLKYAKNQRHDVSCYDLTQSLTDTSRRACAELPNPPYGVILGPYSNFYSNSVFYATKSFSDPGSIWRAKITRSSITHTVEVGFEPVHFQKIPHLNIYNFETREIFVPCKHHCDVTEMSGSRASSLRDNSGSQSQNGTRSETPPRETSSAPTSPSRNTISSLSGDGVNKNKVNIAKTKSVGSTELDHVPLLLFHAKEVETNATRRTSLADRSSSVTSKKNKSCLLYVHGNFGVSILPMFNLPLLLYCKHFDAMLCVVQVRGGGEYGRAWHCKGKSTHKQNAVDDIISAAEYLISVGLTCRDKLGILAGTFGATLAAAAINQRPELFGAAVMEDGVFDLMRSEALSEPMHWFGESRGEGISESTNKQVRSSSLIPKKDEWLTSSGSDQSESTWSREFGRPNRGEEECDRLLSLSPLHNVRPPLSGDKTFLHPSIMCVTNSVSRVPGAHSRKYVAELQRVWGAKGTGGPVVLQNRVEEREEEMERGNVSEYSNDVVQGTTNQEVSRAESRHQGTVKALYFLAYYTGAVYRDNDDSDSESESEFERND